MSSGHAAHASGCTPPCFHNVCVHRHRANKRAGLPHLAASSVQTTTKAIWMPALHSHHCLALVFVFGLRAASQQKMPVCWPSGVIKWMSSCLAAHADGCTPFCIQGVCTTRHQKIHRAQHSPHANTGRLQAFACINIASATLPRSWVNKDASFEVLLGPSHQN